MLTRATKIILLSSSLIGFLSSPVFAAESEVQGQLDQLKTNAENSEKNRSSYEKNQKVADQNVKTLDGNLKELGKQKEQINDNAHKADLNVGTMEKQETQMRGLSEKEKQQIDVENQQVAQLEDKINKVKGNITKRLANQQAYDAKIQTIALEKKQWVDQKKSADDIIKSIGVKEIQAKTDLTEWKKKSEAYTAEVKKWKAEADKNRTTYDKYEKLNK